MANDRERELQTTPGDQVNIVRLLHDEFGTASSTIRMQIAAGRTFIGGEEWKGDPLLIPRNALIGKELLVEGPERAFKMKITE